MKILLQRLLVGFCIYHAGICSAPGISRAAGDLPDMWTAESAVAFAVAGNPDGLIAQKRIEEARAAAVMVNAMNYPQITVSTEYGQTNNPMYSFGNILNQGTFDSSINFNDPGRTDNFQMKAMAAYRLYNGGRNLADRAAAAGRVQERQVDLDAVHQQLGYEVVKNFQTIIQAEQMVTVRQEEVSAITSSLDVGKARHEAGDLLRQDLLNLELQQSRAMEHLIQSKHALELSKRSFLNLLGLQQGNVVIDPRGDHTQQLPETIGYQDRHELKKLEAMQYVAEQELQKAEGGRLPTIDTFASYQVDKGFVEDQAGDSWMAGVKMNYELFDGHRVDAQIALARLKLQELQAMKLKAELALDFDVQQALLDHKQAEERLSVTGKMVAVAEEAARISRTRFKEGVILASELIELEMRLTDARARQLAARAGYRVSIANLRRAAGLPQFSAH